MSKPRHLRKRRRRPAYLLLLLAVLVFAAVYAGAYCLFRAPEQKQEAPLPVVSAEAGGVQDTPEETPDLRSHYERKADF